MNKSIKIIINYFLGPLLFLLLSWILYRQFVRQPNLQENLRHIFSVWKHPFLWISFLLLFVNWGIESLKWKILLSHIEPVGFLRAFKSVLAGTSVTLLTPNRTGEYAGRVLFVKEGHRFSAVSLTVLGSIAQVLITLLMGTIGTLVLQNIAQLPIAPNQHWVADVLLLISAGASILLALLFFRIGWLVRLLEKAGILKGIVKHLVVLETFSRKQLLRILGWSFVRYLVFILQYVLLLSALNVGLPWHESFWLLTFFYLLMAVVPSVGISELPLRATASVEIFGFFTSNVAAVQVAALGIWVINLAIPALMGSLLMLGQRIISDK